MDAFVPISRAPFAGDMTVTSGGMPSASAAVVNVRVNAGAANPSRSRTPSTERVCDTPAARADEGVNATTSGSTRTAVPGTGAPPPSRETEAGPTLEPSIARLYLARRRAFVGTPDSAAGVAARTTARPDGSGATWNEE